MGGGHSNTHFWTWCERDVRPSSPGVRTPSLSVNNNGNVCSDTLLKAESDWLLCVGFQSSEQLQPSVFNPFHCSFWSLSFISCFFQTSFDTVSMGGVSERNSIPNVSPEPCGPPVEVLDLFFVFLSLPTLSRQICWSVFPADSKPGSVFRPGRTETSQTETWRERPSDESRASWSPPRWAPSFLLDETGRARTEPRRPTAVRGRGLSRTTPADSPPPEATQPAERERTSNGGSQTVSNCWGLL